jgi:hypothetical protein
LTSGRHSNILFLDRRGGPMVEAVGSVRDAILSFLAAQDDASVAEP